MLPAFLLPIAYTNSTSKVTDLPNYIDKYLLFCILVNGTENVHHKLFIFLCDYVHYNVETFL